MTIEQHRRSVLARAARATLYHAGEGDKAGGGAGGDAAGDKGGKKDEAAQPKKIELTEDELNERVSSAVKAAVQKRDAEADAKSKKDREEADRKKAEEQGEFKKLADAEREKREAADRERDAARLDKRKLEVKDRLRDYLAEKHPAYAAAAKWMMPAVEFDLATDDKDIDKRIAAAADAYVKDNPRQTGGGGAPGQTGRGTRAAEGEQKKDDKSAANGREREYSLPARRGF